jgi:hypothetical protein
MLAEPLTWHGALSVEVQHWTDGSSAGEPHADAKHCCSVHGNNSVVRATGRSSRVKV